MTEKFFAFIKNIKEFVNESTIMNIDLLPNLQLINFRKKRNLKYANINLFEIHCNFYMNMHLMKVKINNVKPTLISFGQLSEAFFRQSVR